MSTRDEVRQLDPGSNDLDDAVRATVFSPIGGEGLVQQTVRRLGEGIGMGLLKVGERLPTETDLAARLEISPMTLRQALAILRETGYIETSRGKGGGTVVKTAKPFALPPEQMTISAEDLRDLTEYRVAVSAHAAALAAERATASEIEQLWRLIKQMRARKLPFSSYRPLDGRFHLEVAAASRSRRLTEAEATIQRTLLSSLSLAGDHPTKLSLKSSTDQHADIVRAIEARNGDQARHLMETHVRGTADILIGLRLGMIE
jgi:DNA-binding FadR family transcriptional regulator